MPDSRPVAEDVLGVVRDYLRDELAPLVPPYHQFQLRIVTKLLETVGRELELGAAFEQDELARLRALIGRDGPLAELNAELARQIRDGERPIDDARLLDHLCRSTEDALRINNPKWLAGSAAAR